MTRFILVLFSSVLTIPLVCQMDSKVSAVNPFIGTGGHGHTYPGATTPFGMVQLSPDTRIDNSWDGCSGYHYSDSIIYGFSHTHLSGTGVSDYGDLMLLPFQQFKGFNPKEYGALFDKKSESAQAGIYKVQLKKEKIDVRLTTSTRVGFHEYTFQNGGNGSILIDLNHRDELLEGQIVKVNNRVWLIKRRSKAWAQNQHFYARLEFEKPMKLVQTKYNGKKSKNQIDGTDLKVVFTRKVKAGESIKVKVAISFTGFDGATKNAVELDHWDFDRQVAETQSLWDKELSKIEISDNNEEKRIIFYTALYHTMTQPNIAQDIDGFYRGMDNEIHHAIGFDYYTVFSLWDTFRACHPLYTLIDKKRTADFVNTFIAQYEQGGRLPVWELASNETDCMIGYHSVSVIADAQAKGITGIDYAKAFQAAKHSAELDHLGLEAFKRQGFIGVENEPESVSKTVEYAYDDWCIAQLALHQNDTIAYNYYQQRSQQWKNLFDKDLGFIRPRENGQWQLGFDPKEVNNNYTEGNGWQYTFFVPQDIQGMIDFYGGAEKFESKLTQMFSEVAKTTGREQSDITGLVGQYAHGNEPSHHMGYLYNYIGKPQKTKQRIHQLLNDFYSIEPDGLIGNEDCGQMSAWYVLSSMGIYSVTPGLAEWQMVEPIFDSIQIHLEDGTKRIITKQNYKANNKLGWENIQPLAQLKSKEIVIVPVMEYANKRFNDSLSVSIKSEDMIYYRLVDSTKLLEEFKIYTVPISVNKNCKIESYSLRIDGERSKTIEAQFFKKPNNFVVELKSIFNSQYHAGGQQGLVDGVLGSVNWKKGDWQGYQSQDFECVVDLQKVKEVRSIGLSCLQDSRSWILMPTEVLFYGSNDGKKYEFIGNVLNNIAPGDYETQIKLFQITLNEVHSFKYIKVIAKNFGALPEWHQGVGGDAFIFVDEVEVD